jgi:NADPH:quinone reductase
MFAGYAQRTIMTHIPARHSYMLERSMILAVRIHSPGGPEALVPERIECPVPGPGEVLVRHAFIGVNFVDVYHRKGLYPLPPYPGIPGVEGAGIVEAVGEGVTGFGLGDRVAYAGLPPGGYAEARTIAVERLVKLPGAIPLRSAAAMMLRGITARMLLTDVCPIRAGDTVLVHAAAGGLGLMVTQWAKRLGARVIGTVGHTDKAELALAHGLDHAILYRDEDFVTAARDYTDGKGVSFVIDGIGGESLLRSFEAVKNGGVIASVGQAAGEAAPVDDAWASRYPCVRLVRPSVLVYVADPAKYRAAVDDLFAMAADGLRVCIGAEYPLSEAARAHADLEGRRTTGSILLVP